MGLLRFVAPSNAIASSEAACAPPMSTRYPSACLAMMIPSTGSPALGTYCARSSFQVSNETKLAELTGGEERTRRARDSSQYRVAPAFFLLFGASSPSKPGLLASAAGSALSAAAACDEALLPELEEACGARPGPNRTAEVDGKLSESPGSSTRAILVLRRDEAASESRCANASRLRR